MRFPVPALALLVLALTSFAAEAKPTPCPGGRFIAGNALVTGLSSPARTIVVGSGELSIEGVCAIANVSLKAKQKKTKLGVVEWEACEGLNGPVELKKGIIADSCTRLSGVLVSRKSVDSGQLAKRKKQQQKVKTPFAATLSRCGDGFLDIEGGEQCDDGNTIGADGCSQACKLSFRPIIASGAVPGSPRPVSLDGTLTVSTDGILTGQLTATFGTAGVATVSADNGTLSVESAGRTFDLLPSNPDAVLVDGEEVSASGVLELFAIDMLSGTDPGQWVFTSQSVLIFVALASSDDWAYNVARARENRALADSRARYSPLLFSDNFWCKAAAFTGAGTIAAVGGGVCAAIGIACGTATSVTFGIAIPCTVLVAAICEAGLFVGTTLAYEAILEWWNSGAEPSTTTTTVRTTTTIRPTSTSTTTSTTQPSTTTPSTTTPTTTTPTSTNPGTTTSTTLATGVDLVPQTPALSSPIVVPGNEVQVDFSIANQGTTTLTDSYATRVFFSTDAAKDAGDIQLDEDYHYTNLPPTASEATSAYVNVPEVAAAGAAFFLVQVDVFQTIAESNEGNNVLAIPFTVGTQDLVATNVALSDDIVVSGNQVRVDYASTNIGNGLLTDNYRVRLYLSADGVFDASDTLLDQVFHSEDLAPGASENGYDYLTIPAVTPPGPRYFLVQTDAVADVNESNEANNVTPLLFTVGTQDVTVEGLTLEDSSVPRGESGYMHFRFVNQGNGTLTDNFSYRAYLSSDTVFDAGDTFMSDGYWTDDIPAGGSGEVGFFAFPIPENAATGARYVILQTDSQNDANESNEGNNLAVVSVTVEL